MNPFQDSGSALNPASPYYAGPRVEATFPGYGSFDIILDHFSRISQPHTIPRAPCDMLYLVPVHIGCWLVLAIRCPIHAFFLFFSPRSCTAIMCQSKSRIPLSSPNYRNSNSCGVEGKPERGTATSNSVGTLFIYVFTCVSALCHSSRAV